MTQTQVEAKVLAAALEYLKADAEWQKRHHDPHLRRAIDAKARLLRWAAKLAEVTDGK